MGGVVADASVLICLGALRRLHLLKDFYQEVQVPEAAWREIMAASGTRCGAPEAIQAERAGWLKVRQTNNRTLMATLQRKLGRGESEAIALASDLGASLLLIDELDGRQEAKARGFKVTGTLGVLVRAKQAGKLPALKPLLDDLIQQHNFRLARSLYEKALTEVGETP